MNQQAMNPIEIVSKIEFEYNNLAKSHSQVAFLQEQNFANQALTANDYSAKIAMANPNSVWSALRNAASIGISLNPASKHAYLVPRKGAICLDISYMGLMHLAMSTGSILWGQAKLVYSTDTYVSRGVDKAPDHSYSPFGNRGDIVGVYCTVKTPAGDYLTEEVSITDCLSIRDRSEAWKSKKAGPWATDFGEMCKKTAVKRASKYWPTVPRLDSAIHFLNTEGGEGVEKDAGGSSTEDIKKQSAEVAKTVHAMLIADMKSAIAEFISFGSTDHSVLYDVASEFQSLSESDQSAILAPLKYGGVFNTEEKAVIKNGAFTKAINGEM